MSELEIAMRKEGTAANIRTDFSGGTKFCGETQELSWHDSKWWELPEWMLYGHLC